MTKNIFFTLSISTFLASFQAQALDPSAGMGQGLYEQQGANSCLYCHGAKGYEGKKVAASANLSQPKTWKSYKALGGDAALAKNPGEFRKNLEEAVVHLIVNSAVKHNPKTFDKPYFDWKKAGSFNAQMMGLKGPPSQAWLAKYKERGVTDQIAGHATWLYLVTLDTQGVLK